MSIIPLYNATLLFGNLDALLGVNEAFLKELEGVVAKGAGGGGQGVGEVALKHVRPLFVLPLFFSFLSPQACMLTSSLGCACLSGTMGWSKYV